MASQLLGTRAERRSAYNGTLAKNTATESAASDHASQKDARTIVPSASFLCRFHHDALYSTTVSQSLRKAFRNVSVRVREDKVVAGFDGTKDILVWWTSSTNQA